MQTNTDERQEAAAKTIPELVDALLRGDRPLGPKAVDILYHEYRGFHRSGGPFGHRDFNHVTIRTRSQASASKLLGGLMDPNSLTAGDALRKLVALRDLVRRLDV